MIKEKSYYKTAGGFVVYIIGQSLNKTWWGEDYNFPVQAVCYDADSSGKVHGKAGKRHGMNRVDSPYDLVEEVSKPIEPPTGKPSIEHLSF